MPDKGGLGLFCIDGMCNSLLLSQFLRLLKSNDTKSIAHVSFWIGESLTDFLPGTDNGVLTIWSGDDSDSNCDLKLVSKKSKQRDKPY